MDTVKIEKLVFGGEGLGHLDGKPVFAWNALPGETAELTITKNNRKFIHGIGSKIENPSVDRVAPLEDHYLSCSPWQVLSWEAENRWKQIMASESYRSIGGLLESIAIDYDERPTGYRNKMEFSFTQDRQGNISLAFFARGYYNKHVVVESCVLARDEINRTAQYLLQWIRKQHLPLESLKTLILRSDENGHVVAGLFMIRELQFTNYPTLTDELIGFSVFFSKPNSPASINTKVLYTEGATTLSTEINGMPLTYGLLSFFQVNVPMFERALAEIEQNIPQDSDIIDYYSGVGSISLPIRYRFRTASLVDITQDSIDYAQQNIGSQENISVFRAPAERMTELITGQRVIILDPPRAGLHERVVQRLLEVTPPRIIYLSCNVSTHARDIGLLKAKYKVRSLKLFNFFPRTPHIESLAILDRIT